jgi:CRISPR-associated endonuclease/helicase Cas3
MTPFDRKTRLNNIRKRLEDGLPCRVVSTSLIEAGVDLDFPSVFRGVAGLDSILQAAGRCNREGKRSVEESIVHIFQAEKPGPKLFEQNAAVARITMRDFADFSSAEAIESYFRLLYSIKGDALDQKRIMEALRNGIDGRLFPFASVAEMFRLIETSTRTIYIPTGHGLCCIQRLQAGERSRALFREAGLFTVEVYPQHYKALFDVGAIQELDESVSILTDTTLYNSETGLTLTVDSGKAIII